MARRLAALILLMAVEWLPISAYVSTRRGGASTSRWIVTFVAIYLTFALIRLRDRRSEFAALISRSRISARLLALHGIALILFLAVSFYPPPVPTPLLTAVWWISGLSALCLSVAAFTGTTFWAELVRGTRLLLLYAAAASAVASLLITPLYSLWNNHSNGLVLTAVTFRSSAWLLSLFVPDVHADQATLTLGGSRFEATIGDACSGIESFGLMLVFAAAWLTLFRREFRFPHALLLVPAGLMTLWILNVVRITALFVIGNSGARAIAMGGFHSQAGWISFNAVAIAFTVITRKIVWFHPPAVAGSTDRPALPFPSASAVEPVEYHNPTIPYLLPFVAILAASLVSRAASNNTFEALYFLRVLAAAAVLWRYRTVYRELNWRFGWPAVAAGVAVFGLWMALDRFQPPSAGASALGGALAALSAPARFGWIAVRVLGAVVTVPIAEELAFRSFLLRRLISAEFEKLPQSSWTVLALFGSSLAFGLMHGSRWIEGTLAGLIYAAALIKGKRLGEAVAAHAITNALLAVWVLIFGAWSLW